jgi:hypothetical protein
MYARRTTALVLAVLALWPAAPAAAKEAQLRSARACGLTACVRLPAPMIARALRRAETGPGAGDAGFGPYYRLRIRPTRNQPQLVFYLPFSRRIQANGESAPVGAGTAARLRAALRDVQPIPPRITGITVGSRKAAHPGAYTELLYGRPVHPAASVWKRPDVLIWVDLAGETPWVDWGAAEYFPSVRLLHIPDGTWVHVGAAQAAMIASDEGLRPPAAGGSFVSDGVIAAILAVAALAAVAAFRLRPGRRERLA